MCIRDSNRGIEVTLNSQIVKKQDFSFDFGVNATYNAVSYTHLDVYKRQGLNDVFLEQVQTFGDVHRHPASRVVTVAYCSLINLSLIHI